MDAAKIKDWLLTVKHYAQSAANYCDVSEQWVDLAGPGEDGLTPRNMLLDNLACAEADARTALKHIAELRAQIKNQ